MRAASRAISAAVALALLVLGILTAIEIVAAPFRKEPVALPWDGWFRTGIDNTWGSPPLRLLSILLLLLGIGLLAVALAKRAPAAVALRPADGRVRATLQRTSLERSLRRCAEMVDGVAKARASVRKDRVVVQADARRREVAPIRERINDTVQRRLSGIPLAAQPAINVDVRAKDTK